MWAVPAWFAWLHGATRFRLATPQGLITVRKERSGGGRGGWYWRAYRKQRGRLHRFYLGPDTALTPQALAAASAALGALPTVVLRIVLLHSLRFRTQNQTVPEGIEHR